MTAASPLDDSPVHLATPTGLYVPENYDHASRGWVSLRTACAGSLNVPAVRALVLVGTERFVERLRALGFAHLSQDGDYYGYSLALGSAEVTLWELVNAYRSLANGGVSAVLTLQPRPAPAPAKAVIQEGAAFIVSDILADRAARSVTFGLSNALGTTSHTAVKTGTSKDLRDNWCIGYSPHYTVGVWVGNFSGEPMHEVHGGGAGVARGHGPFAPERTGHGTPSPPRRGRRGHRLHPAHRGTPPRVVPRTHRDATHRLCRHRGAPPAHRLSRPRHEHRPGPGYPRRTPAPVPQGRARATGARLADRPSACQIASGHIATGWRPVPGRHHLTLLDPNGRIVDGVVFEVRGRR